VGQVWRQCRGILGVSRSTVGHWIPRSSTDLEGLMRSADAALSAAEHGGRNRVERAPPG
jgi:GGDEF domain-containing protein